MECPGALSAAASVLGEKYGSAMCRVKLCGSGWSKAVSIALQTKSGLADTRHSMSTAIETLGLHQSAKSASTHVRHGQIRNGAESPHGSLLSPLPPRMVINAVAGMSLAGA